jgi:hypothetical protein
LRARACAHLLALVAHILQHLSLLIAPPLRLHLLLRGTPSNL